MNKVNASFFRVTKSFRLQENIFDSLIPNFVLFKPLSHRPYISLHITIFCYYKGGVETA